jgi:hypothetical protein
MQAQIEAIAASFPFGTPSAVKRGKFSEWPYIAVIKDYMGKSGATHNPMGRSAYATREEAVAAAERHIAALRTHFRTNLADPRFRALRQQYGLPRELS